MHSPFTLHVRGLEFRYRILNWVIRLFFLTVAFGEMRSTSNLVRGEERCLITALNSSSTSDVTSSSFLKGDYKRNWNQNKFSNLLLCKLIILLSTTCRKQSNKYHGVKSIHYLSEVEAEGTPIVYMSTQKLWKWKVQQAMNVASCCLHHWGL